MLPKSNKSKHLTIAYISLTFNTVLLILWLSGLMCYPFISIVTLILNSITLIQLFIRKTYSISIWLSITWFNCLSLILHDLLGISFLSSGVVFASSRIFENVRWATAIASSLSSALALISLHSSETSRYYNSFWLYKFRLHPQNGVFILFLSMILFYLTQVNRPLLITSSYIGTRNITIPFDVLQLIGTIATCTFIIGITAVLEYKEKRGFLPQPILIIYVVLVLSIIISMVLKGERATILFVSVVILLNWYHKQTKFSKTIMTLIGCLVIVWLVLLTLKGVRDVEGGVLSLSTWKQAALTPFTVTPYGKIAVPSSSMYHMVKCVELWDSGIQLHGASYLALLPQQLPLFMTKLLWVSRPLSDPERLSLLLPDQPGGIYVIAQAYWNFGMLGVIGFILVMVPLLQYIEHSLARLNFGGVITSFAVAASTPKFMLYGIQWGLKNLLVLIILALFMRYFLYSKVIFIQRYTTQRIKVSAVPK